VAFGLNLAVTRAWSLPPLRNSAGEVSGKQGAQPVKIVHLTATEGRGGASIASARLCRALRSLGHDSQLLVAERSCKYSFVTKFHTRADQDQIISLRKQAIDNQYIHNNRTERSNTHFTAYVDGADLSHHPSIEQADIVHLHWIGSIQTPLDIRLLSRARPVVWTLHDFEPMTGGCHFPAGCNGFKTTCQNCLQLKQDPFGVPAAVLRDKKALWAGQRFVLTSPTHWLAELAQKSAVFGSAWKKPVVIPPPIDTKIFQPLSQVSARRSLGLSEVGPHILCGADDYRERRKGADILRRILTRCSARLAPLNEKVTVISVGQASLNLEEADGLQYRHLGHLNSEQEMALAYAAADLFILPSVEDNLPNMVIESLSCGTPVVAFDIGGIGEVLEDGKHGRLVGAGDENAMSEAVISLLSDPAHLGIMRTECRREIESRCGYEAIGNRYLQVYQKLLEEAGQHSAGDESLESVAWANRTGWAGPELDARLPQWSADCLAWELKDKIQSYQTLGEVATERGELVASLHEVAEIQRREITDLHKIAAERGELVERLHSIAAERGELIESLHAVANTQREQIERVEASNPRAPLEQPHLASGHPDWAATGKPDNRDGLIAVVSTSWEDYSQHSRTGQHAAAPIHTSFPALPDEPFSAADPGHGSGKTNIPQLLRLGDWWCQKIPPLLAVVYVSVLMVRTDLVTALEIIACFVVMVSCVAAYGFVFNDVFDIEADAAAGKPNAVSAVSPTSRTLICVALVAAAFLPVVTFLPSASIAVCLGMNFLWPTLYSMPWIRLKERGGLGLICDAAGSHITPTILALITVNSLSGASLSLGASAAFIAWVAALGFKGIIYHQAADRENDLKSGLRTFATSRPTEKLTRNFARYNLLVELPVSVWLVTMCFNACPLGAAALCCYLILEGTKFALGFQFALSAEPHLCRRSVPFANELFYTVWFPIAASVQLGLLGPGWTWAPLLQLLLFRSQAALQWTDARSVGRHLALRMGNAK
jgi:glycosyltransferase involved in cell wall biosynthesis/4-hydroxybenzoate polyprenyltransferase